MSKGFCRDARTANYHQPILLLILNRHCAISYIVPTLRVVAAIAVRGYMALSHSPKQNWIPASLPLADYDRLLPDLELMNVPVGEGIL